MARPFRTFLLRTPAALVMIVILCAGLLKAADLPAFRTSLESWALIPAMARSVVAIGIPILEIALGGLWLLKISEKRAYLGGGILLVAVTALYLLHVWLAEPPQCNCFGIIARFEEARDGMTATVVRNLVLITVWCVGLKLTERRSASRVSPPVRELPTLARARGFTLIEVILVIALVGLLTLLLLPSLGSVRDKARRLSVLSTMRQHSAIFATYTSDWQDYYPAYARPDATLHVIRSQSQTLVYQRYFDVVAGWNVALADMYYDGRSAGPDFQRQREMAPITNFWYASCFLARPEFWNPATRTGPQQWGGVKASQVQWPASKVLLFDYWRWAGDPPQAEAIAADTDVSLVDGSARSARSEAFLPAYVGGDGDWPGSVLGFGVPGLHTIDGVRGRDFK